MKWFLIIIIVLVLLNIGAIALYLYLGSRLPQDDWPDDWPDDDQRYYDENGNHIYYDRKLIARLKKEQEQKH